MMSSMNIRRRSNVKYILIGFLIIFTLWHILGLYLDAKIRRVEEEVDRINTYFNGTLQVYRIPPWVENAPAKTKVMRLYNINYVLQTEELAERNMLNPGTPAGMPYYPFASKRETLRVFDKLTADEKPEYIIVSNSIIYIGYASEKSKKMLQTAAEYFHSE